MTPQRDQVPVIASVLPFVENTRVLTWIHSGLQATAAGAKARRVRCLPASLVILLLVLASLLRDYSLWSALSTLAPALNRLTGGRAEGVVASAFPQARQRLGAEPVRQVFLHMASELNASEPSEEKWQGLSVRGLDGTTMRTADTEENEKEFGKPQGGKNKIGGYPQIRLLALSKPMNHELVAATIGGYCGKGQGEKTLARKLLLEIPDNSVTLLDKGFLSWGFLWRIQKEGTKRHWLIPAGKAQSYRIVKHQGRGDALAELEISSRTRKLNPGLPKRFLIRVLTYTWAGKRRTLLTSLLDPVAYRAEEVVGLFSLRWETELVFDEIKTKMLCRSFTLRSKSPEMVLQEVWASLIGYNLVRMRMAQEAEVRGGPPLRLSFKVIFQTVRLQVLMEAVFALQDFLMTTQLPDVVSVLSDALLMLPPRRTNRYYPRKVKVRATAFGRKRTRDGARYRDPVIVMQATCV